MARPKGEDTGKRVNIYLPKHSLKIAKDIDNLSEFFQMALEQAAGIMGFDIIQKQRNLPQQKPPTREAIEQFNKDHPLNELTRKRLNKQWLNTQNSPPPPEPW